MNKRRKIKYIVLGFCIAVMVLLNFIHLVRFIPLVGAISVATSIWIDSSIKSFRWKLLITVVTFTTGIVGIAGLYSSMWFYVELASIILGVIFGQDDDPPDEFFKNLFKFYYPKRIPVANR